MAVRVHGKARIAVESLLDRRGQAILEIAELHAVAVLPEFSHGVILASLVPAIVLRMPPILPNEIGALRGNGTGVDDRHVSSPWLRISDRPLGRMPLRRSAPAIIAAHFGCCQTRRVPMQRPGSLGCAFADASDRPCWIRRRRLSRSSSRDAARCGRMADPRPPPQPAAACCPAGWSPDSATGMPSKVIRFVMSSSEGVSAIGHVAPGITSMS